MDNLFEGLAVAAFVLLMVGGPILHRLYEKRKPKKGKVPVAKPDAFFVWEVTDNNGGIHFVRADDFTEVLEAIRKSQKFALTKEEDGLHRHQITSISRLKGRALSW